MFELPFDLRRLKELNLNGSLFYTNAEESGGWESLGKDFLILTSETSFGIDQILLNKGFRFNTDAYDPRGMFWMDREVNGKGKEVLRYWNAKNGREESAVGKGLITRVDFFCQGESNAMYDIVAGLLDYGYKAAIPYPPKSFMIEKFLLLEPDGVCHKSSDLR